MRESGFSTQPSGSRALVLKDAGVRAAVRKWKLGAMKAVKQGVICFGLGVIRP